MNRLLPAAPDAITLHRPATPGARGQRLADLVVGTPKETR